MLTETGSHPGVSTAVMDSPMRTTVSLTWPGGRFSGSSSVLFSVSSAVLFCFHPLAHDLHCHLQHQERNDSFGCPLAWHPSDPFKIRRITYGNQVR